MSKDFYNEIYFRCNSAVSCLDAIEYIKVGNLMPPNIQHTIKYALVRFSVLQLTTILDTTSKYSLRIRYDESSVPYIELARLRKLCSNISIEEAKIVKFELDKLLIQNKGLLKKFFHMRNSRIAHAGRSTYEKHELDMKVFNFPFLKVARFADNIQGIFNKRCLIGSLKKV